MITAAANIALAESAVAAASSDPKGDIQQGKRDIDRALAEAPDDLRILFFAFQFHIRTGDLDTAERLCRRRIELASPDSAYAARALCNLGILNHQRGRLHEAEPLLVRALEIDRRLNNLEGVARDTSNLAMIPESRGDLDRAEKLYREALAVAQQLGTPAADKTAAGCLSNLGDIAKTRGRFDQARSLWTQSEAIFERLGFTFWRSEFKRRWAELEQAESNRA